MKFAVAVGVLAQTLPAVSEKAVDLVSGEKKFDLASILASIPREADGSVSHGKQRRAHGGRRTQQTNAFQQKVAATKNRLLTNAAGRDAKPCNPFSSDADVGILSCAKGFYCQEDENAFLGGKCAPRMAPEGNSIGKSKAFASFGKGGLLKSIREAAKAVSEGVVECDPSGSADVGILSCGEGKQCLASSASSMGGFCAPEAHSRQLYHLTYDTGLCDPTSPDYLYYDCDCTGFDNATGTGNIPCTAFEDYCLGIAYAGCKDTCVTRTVDYTFSNFTAPGYSFCFDFATPYAQKVCFEESFETDSCTMTFNDQPCTSCELVETGNYTSISFDCVNAGGKVGNTEDGSITDLLPIVDSCHVDGPQPECTICTGDSLFNTYSMDLVMVPGFGEFTCNALGYPAYYYPSISADYCPIVSAAAADICCDFYCDLCGPTSYIPDSNYGIALDVSLPGYEGLTCGDLSYAAYYNFTIPEETCPSAAGIAGACCDTYEISCDLCGDLDINPTASFPLEGEEIPCQFLAVFLNETDCDVVAPLVTDVCCSAPDPTSAPAGGSEPAPAGASGLLSTKNLVSMAGLAVAAVAFVMN